MYLFICYDAPFTGVSVVRRASYDVTSTTDEHYNVPVTRSVSDNIIETNSKVLTPCFYEI